MANEQENKKTPMKRRNMGGPGGQRTVEKPKDLKGTTKKLIKNYFSKYKLQILIVFIFAIASTI